MIYGYQLSFDSIPIQTAPAPVRRAVLNVERATAKRQDAITRVETHADAEWKRVALDIVKSVAELFPSFTTDKVVERLAETKAYTHEPRALGPIMQRAAKAGYITATDRFENSAAVSRHKAPKRIWQSQLYRSIEQ